MEKKQVFLQSFNVSKCIVVGLSMVEGQKQPPEVFCKKRCSLKFRKFHRKTLKFLFSKVAGLRPATLIKKRLQHSCFPMEFAKFLRTPILKNISGRLLLKGLFSLLFYCENGINQYAVQKILTDVFGTSLLLLELGCLRYVLILYHLRMLRVYENK